MTLESAIESLAVSAPLSSHPMKDERSESSSFTTSLSTHSLRPLFYRFAVMNRKVGSSFEIPGNRKCTLSAVRPLAPELIAELDQK